MERYRSLKGISTIELFNIYMDHLVDYREVAEYLQQRHGLQSVGYLNRVLLHMAG